MTAAAAHAYEYEVPPHGAAPAEAVEAAEGGQIVYLTRAGRRIAALESAEQRLARLQRIAEFWKQREQETAQAARGMWDIVTSVGADSRTQQQVRTLIDRMMEQVEDAADHAAADVARADPAPSVPLADVLAEHADVLATYPDER
jgi:antitoxin (DNA-binding transcriptional repressor) of toxin-antitoxin stability system